MNMADKLPAGQITPPQATSQTSQTAPPPGPPLKRPESNLGNLVDTGAEIPMTDVVVNRGGSPVEMTPGVPGRNSPTGAPGPTPTYPETKAMAAARKKNSSTFSGPGLGSR